MTNNDQASAQEMEELRGKVQAVLDRAKEESSYLDELKQNPQETLVAAGIPEAATGEVAHELQLGSEVSGYMLCTGTCDRYTCILHISACPYVPLTS